jgi:sulfur transfer protein SufE
MLLHLIDKTQIACLFFDVVTSQNEEQQQEYTYIIQNCKNTPLMEEKLNQVGSEDTIPNCMISEVTIRKGSERNF